MTALPLLTMELPLGLRRREVRVALTGWGLYVAVQAGYCLVHTKVVARAAYDFRGLALWALGEWGIWLLITPLVFRTLRHYESAPSTPVRTYAKLAGGVLAAALTIRMAIDHQTRARGVVESLVIFLPRYAAALALVGLAWRWFLREGSLDIAARALPVERSTELGSPAASAALVSPRGPRPGLDTSVSASARRDEPVVSRPETLLVSKGREECLIRVDRIQYVSAAGNYVEICCDHQLYMLRTTMKQIEALLSPASFLRAHRSHIVSIDEIESIRARPSGNSLLKLRCGKVLSVSKRYKAQLDPLGRLKTGVPPG